MPLDVLASFIAVAAFTAAMIYSAVEDVLRMTVSDRLVLLLLIAYPILAPLAGYSLSMIAASSAAALVVFFISIALFALGWMGGGDGKLLTVGTLWVGAGNAISFVFYMTFIGGVLAASLLAFRKLSLPSSWLGKSWVARLHARETGIPYAVAIGFAGLIVLPNTAWMQGLAA